VYRDVLYTLTGRAGIIGLAAFAVVALLAVRLTLRTWERELHGCDAWAQGLLACWSVLPTVTLVILSPVNPLIGRYLLFSLVGILLYGAVAIDATIRGAIGWRWLRGWRRFVPLGLVLAAGINGLVYWYSDGGEEDWRSASRYVFETATPGDRIIFANDSVRLFFEYYRRFDTSAVLPQPVYPSDPWGTYETGDQQYLSFDEHVVDDLVADPSQRVWVVLGVHHLNTEHVPQILRSMDDAYEETERRTFDGDVDVILYAPR
jgi:hypothetical protein